jgi:hypothetical protein
MSLTAAVLSLVLSQDPAPAPAATDAPPVAAAAPAADAGVATTWAPARAKGADDAAKLLKKWGELKPEERTANLEQVQKQFGTADANPVMPPADFDFDRYSTLSPIDQAKATARHFFNDLITNDTSGVIAHCGFPFMMEDHRLDRVEELRNEWLKSLRGKRLDLLKLYDLEVLAPADMEKKYGAPPRRLQAWGWRAPNTFVAVANLSGHAGVILLRQVGAAWQVVGYHD